MTRITRIITTVAAGTATVALLATPATAEARNPMVGACDGEFGSQLLYMLDQAIPGSNMQYWDDECSLSELREYNDY
jgi:hypothetical protein